MVNNPLHIKINPQLSGNASTINIVLSSLEAPQPSGNNYVNVQQNYPDWLEIKGGKVTWSRLPALLGFMVKQNFRWLGILLKMGLQNQKWNICKTFPGVINSRMMH